MKTILFLLTASSLMAQEAKPAPEKDPAKILNEHAEASIKLAEDQDALSADVQDLIDSQTNPKVIELLTEVETLMAEAIDELEELKTGGETIAVQTEVIEKIFEAAKKKSESQSQGSQSNEAMLEMMQRMMGKKPGSKKGEQEGKGPGQQAGEGQKGDSDAANKASSGDSTGKSSVRRVPKAAGRVGSNLPLEFQRALDAYNRSE